MYVILSVRGSFFPLAVTRGRQVASFDLAHYRSILFLMTFSCNLSPVSSPIYHPVFGRITAVIRAQLVPSLPVHFPHSSS